MSFIKDKKRDRLLIAFDGPDGVGKSTTIQMFADYLSDNYEKIELRYVSPFGCELDVNGKTSVPKLEGLGFCKAIREQLDVVRGRVAGSYDEERLDSRFITNLFFLANAEALRVAQTDAIPKGKKRIYLFDRCYISHEVYQKIWAAELIGLYDLSVILVDNPKSIQRRISARKKKALFDPDSLKEIENQVECYRREYSRLVKLNLLDKVEIVDLEKEQDGIFDSLCKKVGI